ncbi:MAG: ring-1,2-phenylacetyl-CoA epoxidase subunit PaaC [Acidimicrobiales bacterium]|jgi:ring-1,2-phenylacetyl-CoA epoxidase subunit PaaC
MKANLSPGSQEWLLAFADDEHLVGARHAAWIGLGPFLEEDLAFCSIAQDEIGHAIALYEHLTDDLDHFALLRPAADYRSAWLCELPCHEWSQALVRHWLYDQAEDLRWQTLAESSVASLSALAARAQREEAFHREHAELFLSRIARGDEAGRARVTSTLTQLLPYAVAIWEPVAGEPEALADGVAAASSAELSKQWQAKILADLERWEFAVDWPVTQAGKEGAVVQAARTIRSEHFAELQASLQEVIILDPAATW